MIALRRIVRIIFFPRSEWEAIAREEASIDVLLRRYILPLSLLAPLAALELLGADTLPDGYRTHAFLKVPLMMEVVILTDGGTTEEATGTSFEDQAETLKNLVVRGDQMGRNIVIYLDVAGRGELPIEDVLSGERFAGGTHVDLGIEFTTLEALGQGEIDAGGGKAFWRAQRSELETLDGRFQGMHTAVKMDCGAGDQRDLVWFQRDADPAAADGSSAAGATPGAPPLEAPPPGGTPADPEALARLLAPFDLCR